MAVPHTTAPTRHVHRRFAVPPTWINLACFSGPSYYFKHVTDAEALALGVQRLPGPSLRSNTERNGVRAIRLNDGTLTVRITWESELAREPGFGRFMSAALGAFGDTRPKGGERGEPT